MDTRFLTKVSCDFHPGFPLNHRNKVIHTRLKKFDKFEPDSGLSMKFCLEGTEHYRIRDNSYAVTAGKFLLVNRHTPIYCHIDSEEAVEGICYYVDEDLVQEIWDTNTSADEDLLDNAGEVSTAVTIHFREMVYSGKSSVLGKFLSMASRSIRWANEVPGGNDFFYGLAESMIADQKQQNNQVQGIRAEKKSTREELFRRIMLAKNMIEDGFREKVSIADLARESCLSEYHLHRTFRQAFGISPHQYLIDFRIENAKLLLMDKNLRVVDVALQTGFSDIHSFSKTFRKRTGVSPGQWRLNVPENAGIDKTIAWQQT